MLPGGDLFANTDFNADLLGTQDDALDLDGANLTMQPQNNAFNFGSLFKTPNADTIVENVDTGRYKVLQSSPIDISSIDEFERTLMDVFIKNKKYRGTAILERKPLIESLHGYIVTNDKNFGSWSAANPHGI